MKHLQFEGHGIQMSHAQINGRSCVFGGVQGVVGVSSFIVCLHVGKVCGYSVLFVEFWVGMSLFS